MEKILKSTLKGGAFSDVSTARSQIMAAIRSKSNKTTEIVLRLALVRSGIRGWRLHASDIQGRPDFYFDAKRLAIFVDGCFWHGCPNCGHIPRTRTEFWATKIQRNQMRDRRNRRRLASEGIKVMRIWEHELSSRVAVQRTLKKIATRLQKRQP